MNAKWTWTLAALAAVATCGAETLHAAPPHTGAHKAVKSNQREVKTALFGRGMPWGNPYGSYGRCAPCQGGVCNPCGPNFAPRPRCYGPSAAPSCGYNGMAAPLYGAPAYGVPYYGAPAYGNPYGVAPYGAPDYAWPVTGSRTFRGSSLLESESESPFFP
jgi:hypothetical protein